MDDATRRKVAQLIAGLVVADDDLDPQEDVFVTKMLAGFGIPPEERDSLFPIIDAGEAAAKMQELPPGTQQEAFSLLLAAAAADGQIVPEESHYLRTVAKAIGITEADLESRMEAAFRLSKP